MDNKKWYKKISTCFWFLLATMYFWLPIIITIFSFFIHTENNIEFTEMSINGIWQYGYNVLSQTILQMFQGDFLEILPLPFIKDMIYNLLETFEIDMTLYTSDWLVCSLSWFISVYFFELICDFMVWLPKFFHNILNKGVDKID